MAGKLQQEIHQTKAIRLLEEEAALNIVRTADMLMLAVTGLLRPYLLSATQYNVLRILRGAGKDGASCKEIGQRLRRRPKARALVVGVEVGRVDVNRGSLDHRRLAPPGLRAPGDRV